MAKKSSTKKDEKKEEKAPEATAEVKTEQVAAEVAKSGQTSAKDLQKSEAKVDDLQERAKKETKGFHGSIQNVEVVDEEVLATENKKTVDVEVQEKKVKMYEVKFLKDHQFNIGVAFHDKKKDQKMSVEKHIANSLANRGIVTIVD